MKVVAVLLAIACFSLSVEAQNVICGAKITNKAVTVEDGDTFSFKTQKGKKYKGNTKCTVDYKMGDTCSKMSFVCTKFNTNNKDKKKCSKGDKVTVTVNGKPKAYCKTKKPKVISTGDMSVVFTSDKKKHGPGAVCKVKCTEAASGGTGILSAGGVGGGPLTSSEVFLPSTGQSCTVADLPAERYHHTLNTVDSTAVLCGGGRVATEKSCLQFSQASGAWTSYGAALQERRSDHTGWVSPAGLVLMGGSHSTRTTEIINGGMNFTLDQDIRLTCSIQVDPYTIITGGPNSLSVVSKYNLHGYVEDLPSLSQGRFYHGCGSYKDGGNRILVVSGGCLRSGAFISSTEVHILGSLVWTAGEPLPRAMSDMASVSLDHEVMFFGGYDRRQRRSEILTYRGGEWTEVGQLVIGRSQFAATKILVNTTVCD